MRTPLSLAALLVPVVLLASPASASGQFTSAADATQAGPRQSATQVGISRLPAERSALHENSPLRYQRSRRENARLLMIIGASMFVAGVLIDDDAGTLLAVGGLAIGIWGLIQWME